ncbi:MAG: hypothetical protein JSS75_04140 [Bacteroidetes bacterium]|nr:hypothetical protein [Bacteroidota bacterium]
MKEMDFMLELAGELRREVAQSLRGTNLPLPVSEFYEASRHAGTDVFASQLPDLVAGMREMEESKEFGPDFVNAIYITTGVGYYLSSSFIGPLKLTNERHEYVAVLGGIANLITSLFDVLVDREYLKVDDLITRDALRSILSSNDLAVPKSRQANKIAYCWWVMVSRYLSMVQSLQVEHRSDSQADCLRNLCLKMFDSHLASRNSSRNSYLLLRRKVLPILIMLQGGFLVQKNYDPKLGESLWRKVYRIAELIAILDDIVDLEKDIDNDHPNLFAPCGMTASGMVAYFDMYRNRIFSIYSALDLQDVDLGGWHTRRKYSQLVIPLLISSWVDQCR